MRSWLVLGAVMLVLAGCGSRASVPPPAATPQATPATGAAALPPAAGPLPGLAFIDASHGWALVDCTGPTSRVPGQAGCRLAATTNGGRTWRLLAKGLPASARLQFFNAHDGFATVAGGRCTHGLCPGYVLATTDGGASWSTRYAGPVELTSIAFSNLSAGWSIADGGLEASTDGGAHWHASAALAPAIASACKLDFVRFFTPLDGVAGGGGSGGPCVITTRNGGTTWRAAAGRPVAAALRTYAAAVKLAGKATRACRAADALIAPGGAGWLELSCGRVAPGALAVLRTADGGKVWRYVWGAGGRRGGQPLFFLDGAAAWRSAARGEQRTADGGRTWSSGQPLCAAAACPLSLAFVTAERGWARTAGGRGLYATTDGGGTWSRQGP